MDKRKEKPYDVSWRWIRARDDCFWFSFLTHTFVLGTSSSLLLSCLGCLKRCLFMTHLEQFDAMGDFRDRDFDGELGQGTLSVLLINNLLHMHLLWNNDPYDEGYHMRGTHGFVSSES